MTHSSTAKFEKPPINKLILPQSYIGLDLPSPEFQTHTLDCLLDIYQVFPRPPLTPNARSGNCPHQPQICSRLLLQKLSHLLPTCASHKHGLILHHSFCPPPHMNLITFPFNLPPNIAESLHSLLFIPLFPS